MTLLKTGILMMALSLTLGCSALKANSLTSAVESGPDRDLMKAVIAGDKNAMDRALRQGADPNFGVPNPEYPDIDKVYVLELAYENYPETTEYLHTLLEAGAEPNLPVTEEDNTLLFKPLSDTYLEHIKLLIEYGADVNYRNTEYNSTALLGMFFSKSHAAATVMIEAGADPTLENKFGRSLMLALDSIKERGGASDYSTPDFWKLIDALKDKGYIDPGDPYWQR
ncbi:ankyrin repeat domain-containing protein [Halomonas sp. LS-001]